LVSDDKQFKNLSNDGVNQLRRWVRIFTICIILSFAFSLFVNVAEHKILPSPTWQQVLGPPASIQVDETKPLREQTARVELGHRAFNIPLMFIDSSPAPDNVYKDSILLEVIWPEMRSIHELNNRQEYEQIWKKEHRLGWLLLELASARPSLDQMIEYNNETHAKTEHVEDRDGLEMYRWYHANLNDWELSDEVYLQRDATGRVITYIRCDAPNRNRFPRCDHRFVDEGILYDVSYTKGSFFSQWRQQQHRAIGFMRSFELNRNNQP
jgi:hypothetical protein